MAGFYYLSLLRSGKCEEEDSERLVDLSGWAVGHFNRIQSPTRDSIGQSGISTARRTFGKIDGFQRLSARPRKRDARSVDTTNGNRMAKHHFSRSEDRLSDPTAADSVHSAPSTSHLVIRKTL